jgi:prevent-host-death family protein
MTKIITSREFNQDVGRAKRAALEGPVFITDRGRPSHVLLSAAAYEALAAPKRSIVDMLGMKDGADIEFEPPRMGRISRPVDLED